MPLSKSMDLLFTGSHGFARKGFERPGDSAASTSSGEQSSRTASPSSNSVQESRAGEAPRFDVSSFEARKAGLVERVLGSWSGEDEDGSYTVTVSDYVEAERPGQSLNGGVKSPPPTSSPALNSVGMPSVTSTPMSNEEFTRRAESLFKHEDPNQHRLNQAPPDTLSSQLGRAFENFKTGVVNGPAGGGGGPVDPNNLTELQVGYALGTDGFQRFGEGLRKVLSLLPVANTVLETESAKQLHHNPYLEKVFGRSAEDAAASALFSLLQDIIPFPGGGSKSRMNVDMPNMHMPNVDMPNMHMPNVDMPNVDMPAPTGQADAAVRQVDEAGDAVPTRLASADEPMTMEQLNKVSEALLRGESPVVFKDPLFGAHQTNGVGKPGQYNLEGARTMEDVARKNSDKPVTDGRPTIHDVTHSTLAGEGGIINNSVYPDGVNGILVAADNLIMKDFMQKYGGKVTQADLELYVQKRYLEPQLKRDPSKFDYELDITVAQIDLLLSKAGTDESLREKALSNLARKRNLLENSQEYGYLNHRNYQPDGVPTPQSESIREAVDAAWGTITEGYKTGNRALVDEGRAQLRHLQRREMLANVIPKEQAVELLKDHITYHTLWAQQYSARHGGTVEDYFDKLGDKFNSKNPLLQLEVPTREQFDKMRRELFPGG